MDVLFYDKDMDMLKHCSTLPNLANICPHKSTDAKFQPFTEAYKDILEKFGEVVARGPSIVFRRKAVVDETLVQKSTTYATLFLELMLAT